MNDLERLSQLAKQHVAPQVPPPAPAGKRIFGFWPWPGLLVGTACAQLFRPGLSTLSACVGIAIFVLDGNCGKYLLSSGRLWYQRLIGQPWHWDRGPSPSIVVKSIVALVLVLGAPLIGGSVHTLDLALRSGGVDPSQWNLLDVFAYLFVGVVFALFWGVVIGGAVMMARRRESQTTGGETDVPQTREEIESRR